MAGELDSETSQSNVATVATDSSTFVLEANQVDAVAIKIVQNSNLTGTLSVTLRNSTTSTNVATTTIAFADVNSSFNGWYVFALGLNHTPNGTDSYVIRVQTGAGTISLYTNGVAGNWTRQIRRTATQAPAASDKLIIAGEHTGSGTGNSFTVTMDNTATTSFGPTVSGGPPQGMTVNKRGTLTFSTSIAAYLKLKGILAVYGGGTLNVGTSGARIGASSSAILEMDSAANVDSGLVIFPGGTLNAYGDNARLTNTLMTADKAAAATVISVASTAGWSNTDVYAFASTTRTASDCESKTGATVDSATQITLAAGLTNAHSGTSPTQAEVVNLTRNVKIRGVSASLQGYCFFSSTAVVNADYVEFTQLGSGTSGKRGIEAQTTAGGTVSLTHCSLHDSTVASSIGMNMAAPLAGGSTFTFSNNTTFNIANVHFNITGAIAPTTWTLDSNVFIRNTDSGANLVTLSDVGGTFTNNTMVGATNNGLSAGENGATVTGTFSGNTSHSNGGIGVSWGGSQYGGTISNTTIWRNTSFGLSVSSGASGATFSNLTLFGNTSANINLNGCANLLFSGGSSNGDSTFATATGVSPAGNLVTTDNAFEGFSFGVASGILVAHATADINPPATNYTFTVVLRNCLLASTTEVAAQSNLLPGSYIRSQKHDQTAGNHKTWLKYGTLSVDTTIFDVASPSARLTPNDASNKLAIDGGSVDGKGALRVPVASGGAATVSVRVRKSVVGDGTAYNGGLPRLVLRKNVAAGIAADAVLATATSASNGAWETISGTSAAVTDDCVLSFVVDCDGTTGWVNVDDWTVSGSSPSLGLKFWSEGEPFASPGAGGAVPTEIFGVESVQIGA